jgi:peptidoglycan/xylan/chitin deacetylase (PgdA/CDA1 family)
MRFAHRPVWFRRSRLRTRGAGSQRVLLTFDDGPHPEHTPAVLDRLAAHGVRAAFFLVGSRIASAPHLPQRIASAGHVVGNHTFSHRRFGWWERSGPLDDVTRCQELLPAATWFRPPLGRLTPGLWRAARRHGLRVVNWSLDSNDWRCRGESDARACAAEVLASVRPGDIILFHDDRPWVAAILDVVLPELRERGLV